MRFFLAALAWMLLAAILIGVWLWLALRPMWRLYRGTRPSWYAWVPLQISLVVLALGLTVYPWKYAVLLASFPPLVLFDALFLGHVSGFLGQIAVIAVPAAVVAALLCVAFPPLRVIAAGVGLATLGSVTLVAGERISQTAMCTEARAFGVTEIARSPLAWSIGNRTGGPSHSTIHALAEVDGTRYGWSYSAMGWYELPKDIAAGGAGGTLRCPAEG
ncbi:hypothetical protein [uncultured Roseobacter sp.]|uniref:hypothetical protein n=1 Tax=uncultured Roseobacter sp. TaxID=114847 RepID=UPI0026181790|nr:hypothetical protein [uncultured Roseobacter sp.]